MRFIGDKLKSAAGLIARVWRRALRIVPDMDDAPQGFVPRALYNLGFFRTLTAPSWRSLLRWTLIATGFCLYIFLQLVLAYLVDNLLWTYVVAVFLAAACLVFAASKPTQTFVVWLVISPLGFLFLRMDFGEAMPAITFDRIALLGIAGLLIMHTMIDRKRIKRPILGEWFILMFIAYTFLMVVILHPGNVISTLRVMSEKFDHIVLAVVAYYVAKSVLITRKHLSWAVIGLVITGIYIAASSFYEHYTGSAWFTSFMGGFYRLAYSDVGGGRSAGPLFNPAAMGTFVGTTAFLSFHLYCAVKHKALKFFYLAAMVFQIIGCYFCFTRSGYLAPVILLIAMPFFAKCYRKQYVSLVVMTAIISMIVLPILLSDQQIKTRMTKENTLLFRVVITATTINLIKHHPLFGVGLGDVDEALQQYITNAGSLSGLYARGINPSYFGPQQKLLPVLTSHNSILTICAEQGLIGGGLYVGAFLLILLHLFRVRARAPEEGLLGKDLIAFLIVASIGFFASILGYDIRFFRYPNYVLWLLFGIGVRLGEILDQEKHEKAADGIPLAKSVGELTHA